MDELLFDNNEEYYNEEYREKLDNEYGHNLELNNKNNNLKTSYSA